MGTASRFNDNRYKNWIRGTLALQYWKEGLKSFLDDQTVLLHKEIKNNVSSALPGCTCGAGCSPSKRMKMDNWCMKCSACSNGCDTTEIKRGGRNRSWFMACSTCNAWLQQIITYYTGHFPNLGQGNCDPQLWPTMPWEVVKIFMSFGCKSDRSANDADAQATLSLFKNCKHFWNLLKKSHLVEEMVDIRNALFHSSSMCVEDVDLQKYHLNMVDFLQNITGLSPTQTQQKTEAIRKIQELQTNVLDLSLNKELELKALQQRQIALEQDLKKEQYSYSIKLGAIDPELKALQQKQESLEQELKNTTGTLQKEQDSSSKKLSTIDPELTALKEKQIALEQDLKTTTDTLQRELDSHSKSLGTINPELKSLAESMNKLKESSEKFQEFLQKNDLLQDLTRFSSRLEDHDQRLFALEEQVKSKEVAIATRQGPSCSLEKQRKEVSKEVLRRCYGSFVKEMEPDTLLDKAIETGLFESTKARDIRDFKTTSEKNRTIIEYVSKLGVKGYTQFKNCLNDAGQEELVNAIVETEETLQDGDKQNRRKTSDSKWASKEQPDLQTLLKTHYRNTCLVAQDPTEDSDIKLKYLYAEPAVRVLRQSKGRDGLTNVKEEAESMSCKKIFYTDDYSAREIYITGDAGLGKSLLCKHLVELWCEAHGDNDSDSDEEGLWSQRHAEQKARREENRQILSRFKFLFYITLRDSLSEYTITEMIQSQILQYYEDIKHVKVSDVLKNECCLVIVDGLDEWVCPEGRKVPHFVNPGIPGREVSYEKTVFLTTTRPWKFDVLRLTNVDKHAELCGIDKLSASQLCSKVIKLLNKNETRRKRKREFYRALKQKGLDDFKTIPVILIQLICLWFDDQELCKSQVQLYCSMLNMLLKKAQNKLTEQTTQTPSSVQSETPLHECFLDHPHCQNYQQLINCLSEVAFEALVNKTKENQLVFESSIMRIYGVDEDSINLCLKSGILSQNKMYVKRSVSEKKFSFLHKKFQEFLASVFIANSEDVQNVSKRLTEFCSTVKGCLEMSQVWLFVSGMRPDIARQLLDHFTNVITADTDKLMKNYRQTLRGEGLILDIQTCVTNCISEGESNGHKYEKIPLNDVYIEEDTLHHVERMLLGNVWATIKSVYINTDFMTGDQLALITGQLEQTKLLEKLHLVDWRSRIPSETLETVIDNCTDSLTCLHLQGDLEGGWDGIRKIELEHGSVSAICRSISKRLMSLSLNWVKLTDVDKVELLHKLSQSSSIRELYLWLDCTDHGDECRPRIDVSTMTQLQTLWLRFMCVDNLPTVTQCMERVYLFYVTLSMTTLCEFARNISQTKRHVEVELRWVRVREESEDRVDLETFLRERPGLTVTCCEYRDSDKYYDSDSDDDDRYAPTKLYNMIDSDSDDDDSERPGLTVTDCEYIDWNKTWWIDCDSDDDDSDSDDDDSDSDDDDSERPGLTVTRCKEWWIQFHTDSKT